MENMISEKSRKIDYPKVIYSSRNPKCAHCQNHGVQTILKGHKAYCPYRNCKCDYCQLVRMRQKVMAKNVALRRRQVLDRIKIHEILHKRANEFTSLISGEKDGEHFDQEPETSKNRNSESNHMSAFTVIVLNFYNNDPKIALDNIKRADSELSSLIQVDPVNSELGQNVQHSEGEHLNSDIGMTSAATPSESFTPTTFTSNSKKVIFPATPSMFLSPFHPLALKTYCSTLAQGKLSTSLSHESEKHVSKSDLQASLINESPFSIKSLTSELKSKLKPHQVEKSHPIIPFFGVAGHLHNVPAFAFSQPQHPFACLPFPTFQATTMWTNNWCRMDHNINQLPTHN